jgi:hypothetical protein
VNGFYDADGNKLAIGEYNTQKVGKFFLNGNKLNEVEYSNSRIASVKTWKQDALVNN